MTGIDSLPRKTVPFIYVIDTSGSMMGDRIATLNESLRDTIEVLRERECSKECEIEINVLSYSTGCKWMYDAMQNVAAFQWRDLQAGGLTDLGAALDELNGKLNKKFLFGEKSEICFPNIIFFTDGVPTDDWEKSFNEIQKNKWFRGAMKIAVKIGDDVDVDCLSKLVGSPEAVVDPKDLSSVRYSIRICEYEIDDVIKDETDVVLSTKNSNENNKDSIAEGFYLELPSQIVNIENEKTPILLCQLRPCSQEEALKEALVLEHDRKTGNMKLKNICVENLWVSLKVPNGWGEAGERHLSCSVGETIRFSGIAEITKTEQGITFVSDTNNWEKWNGDAILIKEVGLGGDVDFFVGDSIVIGNETIATLKEYPSIINNQSNNPFDF